MSLDKLGYLWHNAFTRLITECSLIYLKEFIMASINVSSMTLSDSFAAFRRVDADRGLIIHHVIGVLGDDLTYESYERARITFGVDYRIGKPQANDDAINMAWSRFQHIVTAYCEDNGYDFTWPAKPKATTLEAVKKQAARKVPEVVAKAETVEELNEIVKPDDKVAAAKLEAAIAAKRLALVKAEEKQAEKAVNAALKARRDALVAIIRKADAVQLAELEAMAEHNAPVVMASLPLEAVQAAMPKLLALAAKAPAKTQAKKGAKAKA